MTLKIPDRYKPTGPKLTGGMGEVLIYKDQNLDRDVAIKNITHVTDLPRLLDEISALQEIRSKHVVEIYDIIYGTNAHEIAIVEAFIPGGDLLSLPIISDSKTYLNTLYQIASGIADIHDHNRIHRDIKPNNMKFDDEKLLKIFDFGLSRIFGAKAITVGFKGTLGFAAPELFGSGKIIFTAAVDTYAFGATAWYLATHSFPVKFTAIPPQLPVDGMDFSNLNVKLPQDLTEMLNFCLEIDPKEATDCSGDQRIFLQNNILFGGHHALLVVSGGKQGGKQYDFHGPGKKVDLAAEGLGKLTIQYDGLNFSATAVDGEVFVNYAKLFSGYLFSGSCVIALGSPAKGTQRVYITFDIADREYGHVRVIQYSSYGFITRDDGADIFFHMESVYGRKPIVGNRVCFCSFPGGAANRAHPVIRIR